MGLPVGQQHRGSAVGGDQGAGGPAGRAGGGGVGVDLDVGACACACGVGAGGQPGGEVGQAGGRLGQVAGHAQRRAGRGAGDLAVVDLAGRAPRAGQAGGGQRRRGAQHLVGHEVALTGGGVDDQSAVDDLRRLAAGQAHPHDRGDGEQDQRERGHTPPTRQRGGQAALPGGVAPAVARGWGSWGRAVVLAGGGRVRRGGSGGALAGGAGAAVAQGGGHGGEALGVAGLVIASAALRGGHCASITAPIVTISDG